MDESLTTLVTVGGERDYPGHIPSGPVGRHLVARLITCGKPVRVLAPPLQADNWPPLAEVVVGDVANPDEVSAAFNGIDRIFLAGAEPESVHQLVTQARRGGAQHIVLLSSHGPDVEIQFAADSWYWLAVEVVVERSGATWTHLQPSPTMAQTLQPGFPDTGSDLLTAIRNGHVVREASLDDPYPLIDEDDLAAVAMAALFDDRYHNQTLAVHGEPISLREQLALIGKALGRTVQVEELTPDQAAKRYRELGIPDDEIASWIGSDTTPEASTLDPDHRQWMINGQETLNRILGRPSSTYADYLTGNLATCR